MVRVLLQKVSDLQLVFQSQVHVFGLFPEFGINIDSVAALQCLVKCVKLLGINSSLEVILVVLNLLHNRKGAANGSLFFLGVPILEDPVTLTALPAVELVTLLAEVSDVFEIEFGLAALALGCFHGFIYQLFVLGLRGQVKRTVVPRIHQVDIDTLSQEAFEHFDILGCSGLVHGRVPILVDVQWRHSNL